MSEYKQRPLASQAKTTNLTDAEYNISAATQILGGSCYSGGVAVGPFTGAIGKDQLKEAAWITTARKTEPYAIVAFQGFIADLTGSGAAKVCIPGVGFIKDAVGVEYGLVYSAITGGATFSGSLAVKICGTAMTTKTITNLAAATLTTQSISGATWTPDETEAGNFIEITLTNSSAGVTISDCVITVYIKAKHIA